MERGRWKSRGGGVNERTVEPLEVTSGEAFCAIHDKDLTETGNRA